MLPAVASEGLATLTDIFVEHIAFDRDDLRRLAQSARALGLGLLAHTEQLSAQGGTALAAELGALACSHLEYCDERDVEALAAHGTVAVLLPGAFYFLRESKPPSCDACAACRWRSPPTSIPAPRRSRASSPPCT
jgi:imidazolonepropionase